MPGDERPQPGPAKRLASNGHARQEVVSALHHCYLRICGARFRLDSLLGLRILGLAGGTILS
jgi:hypothetical protein